MLGIGCRGPMLITVILWIAILILTYWGMNR